MAVIPKSKKKIRVGLIVGEFFDQTIPGYGLIGGYGMLARHYIAAELPSRDIELEVILGFGEKYELLSFARDDVVVNILPNIEHSLVHAGIRKISNKIIRYFRRRAVKKFLAGYDVFILIEASARNVTYLVEGRPLIVYFQDPRPAADWVEIDTVPFADTGSPRPVRELRRLYKDRALSGMLFCLAQGEYLIPKARDLYDLPVSVPVEVLKNPVRIQRGEFVAWTSKKKQVIWLGRLDSVKRPWLALEVAKRLPDVRFVFFGQAQQPVCEYIIYPYRSLDNVTFVGHNDGALKSRELISSSILINTSIHEATPVSFLEALSVGALIVSCQNPDDLTKRFGRYTGVVLGDGREHADLFVDAISSLLSNSDMSSELSMSAQRYVRSEHDVSRWGERLRGVVTSVVEGTNL